MDFFFSPARACWPFSSTIEKSAGNSFGKFLIVRNFLSPCKVISFLCASLQFFLSNKKEEEKTFSITQTCTIFHELSGKFSYLFVVEREKMRDFSK
jgi:hypothetical protein